MKRFEGKIAIVTGAAQGLGKQISLLLLQEGATVIAADIEGDTLAATAEELKPLGTFVPWTLDVADAAAVQQMVDKTVADFGRIDVLFSNAGTVFRGSFFDAKVEELERTYAVNVGGVFITGQAVAKVMINQESRGVIVNTASIASDYITPNTITYAASKGATKQLTKVMAADLAQYGIRVNSVAPGFMATRMIQGTLDDPARLASIQSKIPMARPGQPVEMARVALFLASDDASYMTGEHVLVDGGWSVF